MFPCVLCLFWDMTGPDTALISIRLLLERPKIFSCTTHISSLLQRPLSNENVSGGRNKGPVLNKQQLRNSRALKKHVCVRSCTHTHRQTHTHHGPPTSFCYKKSKNRKRPWEPKVLTLNQIPLDLNWQARPGFRLRYHILEQACMYLRIPYM